MSSNSIRLLSETRLRALKQDYRCLIPLDTCRSEALRNALDWVLGGTGGMLRGQLAMAVMLRNNDGLAMATRTAVAIEYFHAASLVLDDLPCMDGAAERRGRPCTHVIYGEAIAQLAALALINRAHTLLWESAGMAGTADLTNIASLIEDCLGATGILDGQALDLNYHRLPHRPDIVDAIGDAKTGSLLRLSLLLPACLTGCTSREIDLLDSIARWWGNAYQIMDDFADVISGCAETGKTANRDATLDRPNYLLTAGLAATAQRLDDLLEAAHLAISALIGRSCGWLFLAHVNDQLRQRAESTRCHREQVAQQLDNLSFIPPADYQLPKGHR